VLSYDYDVTWFLEGLLFIVTGGATVYGLAEAYILRNTANWYVALVPAAFLILVSVIVYWYELSRAAHK